HTRSRRLRCRLSVSRSPTRHPPRHDRGRGTRRGPANTPRNVGGNGERGAAGVTVPRTNPPMITIEVIAKNPVLVSTIPREQLMQLYAMAVTAQGLILPALLAPAVKVDIPEALLSLEVGAERLGATSPDGVGRPSPARPSRGPRPAD